MDLTRIHYFTVTAQELHFARAAARLGITQPPLSRSIRLLEEELGVQLFSRENKWKISLTAAGKIFLPEAERLLRQAHYAKNLARAVGKGTAGRLTIGAISSMLGHPAFIDTLADMQRHFPLAVVEIIDSTSGELDYLIRERSIDLAFMRIGNSQQDEDLICRKLYDDPILLALSQRHRLVKRKKLFVSDLAEEPFILVPETVSGVFRNCIRELCRKYGNFEPRISQEISNSYTALRLAAAGVGITMVSAAYHGMFGDRLCYRRFTDVQPELAMYVVAGAQNRNPLAGKFQELLIRHLKSMRLPKLRIYGKDG